MLQQVTNTGLEKQEITLWVLRTDQIHPQISGNKWFKLKYNLTEAKRRKFHTLLTFGGAYSNHIYATARAGQLGGFRTIGIIRGEKTLPLNETLAYAKEVCGMELHYMNRTTYRQKHTSFVISELQAKFGSFYLIPEGGTNVLAVEGCKEILTDIDLPFDTVCVPVGTGGTLAGLVASLKTTQQALGFAVLKGGDFLYNDVNQLLKAYDEEKLLGWQAKYRIALDYHFGGYAKRPEKLCEFVNDFSKNYQIPIEPIYTGKMFWGIFDLVEQGFFKKKSVILAVHTGGLRTNA
ncbi:MAG: 1-aminocyclopropane-1-carboxylate deaminase/D-cysteine desulfhydrase [Thermonemataceae bacterium]